MFNDSVEISTKDLPDKFATYFYNKVVNAIKIMHYGETKC